MGAPSTRFGKWIAGLEGKRLSRRHKSIVLVSLVGLSVLVTASVYIRDASERVGESRLIGAGVRSQARVESVHFVSRSDFAQVEVLILEGPKQGVSVRTSLDRRTRLEPGDIVEVAYQHDDAARLVIVGEQAAPNNGPAIAAWVITAMFAVSMLRSRPRPKSDVAAPD
jgi:hypothetical protein